MEKFFFFLSGKNLSEHFLKSERFGTRVAELTSRNAEAWQTKVNIVLMRGNFYQSHVLNRHWIVSIARPCHSNAGWLLERSEC